jgi:NADH-quinone oxidoreductase subunit L
VHAFFKALLFLGAGCVIAAMHHEQDIFRMGGLRRAIPLTFWPFLAGAACLAGLPLTGGFFSKDSILAAVWMKGGALYGGLYLVGLATALLTSVYTFRMVYLVFGGEERAGNEQIPLNPPLSKGDFPSSSRVPRLMEKILIPLALLGLFGGLLDLPGYLGGGWLGHLFGNAHAGDTGHGTELLLQAVAGLAALGGVAIAHLRYGGERRHERVAAAAGPESSAEAFFRTGWRFDDLYRFLFVRPFEALARVLWERVDEGVIDDSLDRLANLFGRAGQGLGSWATGRVSVYLLSLAAGLALMLVYLAWVVVW